MLTDTQLRALKPAEKIYKVADQRGLCAAVMPSGAVSLRYDYRVNGRRETLVIGRYDPSLSARKPRKSGELVFGMAISLSEARMLRDLAAGQIPGGSVLRGHQQIDELRRRRHAPCRQIGKRNPSVVPSRDDLADGAEAGIAIDDPGCLSLRDPDRDARRGVECCLTRVVCLLDLSVGSRAEGVQQTVNPRWRLEHKARALASLDHLLSPALGADQVAVHLRGRRLARLKLRPRLQLLNRARPFTCDAHQLEQRPTMGRRGRLST